MLHQTDRSADEIYVYVIRRFADGASRKAVRAELMRRGISEDVARRVIRHVKRLARRQYRKQGLLRMAFGAVAAALGVGLSVAISLLTIRFGYYVVGYGAVACGLITFLGGLVQTILGTPPRT